MSTRKLLLGFAASASLLLVVLFNQNAGDLRAKDGDKEPNSPELKKMGAGFLELVKKNSQFPVAGTPANGGFEFPSWQFQLLPFIGQKPLFDRAKPDEDWDSAANRPVFETNVPTYFATYEKKKKNEDGLALSHYSANSHVLGRRASPGFGAMTDGTSNTILAGQIGADYPAWGQHSNVRDPALGLDGKSDHFGRPDGSGALFLMCDGSIRSVTSKVDPKLLKGLATINGGEDLSGLTAPPAMAAATPKDKKKPKTKPKKDEAGEQGISSDADIARNKFRSHYRLDLGQSMTIVNPLKERDQLLGGLLAQQNPNNGNQNSDVWLRLSEGAAQLADRNGRGSQPPWTPNRSTSPAGKPIYCAFTYCSGVYTLQTTAHSWTLKDLIQVYFARFGFNSKVRVEVVDRDPLDVHSDLVFEGDIVVNRCDVPFPKKQPGVDEEFVITAAVKQLIFDLEDVCAIHAREFRNLRFKPTTIEKPVLVFPNAFQDQRPSSIPARTLPFSNNDYNDEKMLLAKKMGIDGSGFAGSTNIYLMQCVMPEDLPEEPSADEIKADPEALTRYQARMRTEYIDRLTKAGFTLVGFRNLKFPAIEIYSKAAK